MPATLLRLPEAVPDRLEQAALAYAAAGIPVFPCVPAGKTPLTHNGLHEATTDPSRIRSWWRWQPKANVGIPTGIAVDALDVDLHADSSGYPALQTLMEAGLVHGWSHLVTTPSGGLHIYFPADTEHTNRNWSRRDARIDFRGTGGYIIAPPSRVEVAGIERQYAVVAFGPAPAPIDGARIKEFLTPPRTQRALPPPHAPGVWKSESRGLAIDSDLLVDFGGPVPPKMMHSAQRLRNWLADQQQGNRHPGLFWAACRLAETGASETYTVTALGPPAQRIGIEDSEILRTIANAHREAALTPSSADAGTAPPTGWQVTR